jgi:hypothetical protein
MNFKPPFAMILCSLIPSGCMPDTPPPAENPDSLPILEDSKRPQIAALNHQASDPSVSKSKRAEVVVGLFRSFIRPGDGIDRIRTVFPTSEWTSESKFHYAAILGGHVPVNYSHSEDMLFALHLFPDPAIGPKWVIYLVLSGKSAHEDARQHATDFFQGHPNPEREIRLKDFTICHPDGQREWFIKEK